MHVAGPALGTDDFFDFHLVRPLHFPVHLNRILYAQSGCGVMAHYFASPTSDNAA